ncbi:ABC transporter ATP-binding protein [Arthrobacter sp. B3I4]|uniref:ABC transporter ATP-binding protein n=1 Tax=Arthrobacter sp. B3I4 TaxID=3042267 RepID=UPI0027833717|nr:ABC transporter ATP-binding protein [Arthrobacter sp. B3I4]MDQ0757360.1 putative spermidine/putrescine transport system ATP-binding protein [Arthrobacter sp. B3I4]
MNTRHETAPPAARRGTIPGQPLEGLEITGLSKVLGGRTIIDDLNLSVNEGELVSLLGPSGCGKTTTLRMIAGFLTPDQGSIKVAGRDVTALGADKRPSAMVFQNYALWPHMTVFKNVAFPLKLRKLPKAEIEEHVSNVLGLVNLLHHKHSRPGQISGGEQQRVALARALVQEPDLLLLDEPLSNLDAKLRVKVREDIREIQQRLGITTVIVTHDQDEALSMSDRIAVMNNGRIEQYSTPAELYAQPKTAFVAGFIGTMNRIEGTYRDGVILPGEDVVGIRPEDVVFSAVQVPGSHPATVERIVPRGHFHEVLLQRADAKLRAYISGDVPPLGSSGFVRINKAMTFRDDQLVSDPSTTSVRP